MPLSDAITRLLSNANLSPEDRAKVEDAFSIDAVSKAVEAGTMNRSDYSRRQDELAAERTKLETERAKLTNDWNIANAEYQRMQDSLTATQAEKDAALKKATEVEAKLTKVEGELKIDPTKIVTPERFQEEMTKFARGQQAYFSEVDDVRDRVQTLAGKRLSVRTILDSAEKAGKTPEEWAQAEYKLDELQAAADAKAKTEYEEKLRQEGYTKGFSEGQNPATRPLTASRDPFYVPVGGDTVGADGKPVGPKQPWDMDAPSEAETKLLEELQSVHASG